MKVFEINLVYLALLRKASIREIGFHLFKYFRNVLDAVNLPAFVPYAIEVSACVEPEKSGVGAASGYEITKEKITITRSTILTKADK